MRTKGSAEALEMRRMIGGKMLQEGKGVREVSRLLGVSPATVSRWKQALEGGGLEALRAKPHPGRAPKLSVKQKEELEKVGFVTLLHRHLRRKFILVLDRYSAHRKAVRILQEEHPDWFEVEWLPAYAPDLNSVEMVWNHSKYGELANFIPEDVNDLQQAVRTSLENTRGQTWLLHG